MLRRKTQGTGSQERGQRVFPSFVLHSVRRFTARPVQRDADAIRIIQALWRRLSSRTQAAATDGMAGVSLALDDATALTPHVHATPGRTLATGRGVNGPESGHFLGPLPGLGYPSVRMSFDGCPDMSRARAGDQLKKRSSVHVPHYVRLCPGCGPAASSVWPPAPSAAHVASR